jgi:c(7)-type cytochrome triheme protein
VARPTRRRRGLLVAAVAALLATLLAAAAVAAWATSALWQRLEHDGVHDPLNPGLAQLQQPGDALQILPRDTAGNLVNWVRAIDSGAIQPRSQLQPGTPTPLREDDLIIARYGSMPAVRFPHRQHTLWLDCANCHDHLFKAQAGANRFSMTAILNGEQCGVCHGAVAFPLTECNRCHSVSNASLRRTAPAVPPRAAAQPASAPPP